MKNQSAICRLIPKLRLILSLLICYATLQALGQPLVQGQPQVQAQLQAQPQQPQLQAQPPQPQPQPQQQPPQPQPQPQLAAAIPYRTSDDAYTQEMCTLDISYTEASRKEAVIVWFHGGGLTGGKKELPQALIGKGYVVVGVGYRLCPQVRVPDCIDDAAAAVAWVWQHIADYGGDPTKIVLAGHSAGGYLVSMIGLDKHWLASYGVNANEMAAVAPYSGQAISHFQYRNENGISNPLQPTIDAYAPLYHVRADAPPLLILSGDREMELYGRYEENAYFVRMLRLVGHQDVTFYEVDGFDHGGMAAPGHLLLLKYMANRFK